jgi:hypothetical protein
VRNSADKTKENRKTHLPGNRYKIIFLETRQRLDDGGRGFHPWDPISNPYFLKIRAASGIKR